MPKLMLWHTLFFVSEFDDHHTLFHGLHDFCILHSCCRAIAFEISTFPLYSTKKVNLYQKKILVSMMTDSG